MLSGFILLMDFERINFLEEVVMAITRYNPFRDLMTLSERLNKMFDEGMLPATSEDEFLTGAWVPAVDIYETENEIVIKAEVPGMSEKDVEVTVENNMLTIKGERKFEEEVKKENYHRIERAYGTFQRSFQLPATVNVNKITAEQKDGILTIRLPKKEEQKPKKINIKVKK